ncbi:J domain-containing protein, partial [Massilia sp. TWR1-2-2]|uniref:J domain-containing protein n=1 Tax=Massilia sp. TWR1-2-2 TaxID=2804584 RepID=UPI003CF8EA12
PPAAHRAGGGPRALAGAPPRAAARAPLGRRRDPKWWLALGACFAAGCAVGLLAVDQPRVLPAALASVLGTTAVPRVQPQLVPESATDPAIDSWAVGKAYLPDNQAARPPDIKALAVTQLIVPAHAPDCDSDLQSLVAPNGESWPVGSGYVDGYLVGNQGEEMQIKVDNSANPSAVFVKLYDLDRRANVRHAYVLAHATLAIDRLAAGKYEVRYQNVDAGAGKADCAARVRAPAGPAPAAAP